MDPKTDPSADQPVPEQSSAPAPQIGDAPMPASKLSQALTEPTSRAGVGSTPAAAHDNDLIEKEWVLKAKEILQSNRSNPYELNQQLAALKADYMRKRYGKEVKLSE